MNISYNWLKEYLSVSLAPDELAKILTSIGLEVGNIESFQSVKGGLKGLVIGQVKTCAAHPNSDHLSITTVDLGDGLDTPIVCGAPNVAAGQKVVVATLGTILYNGNDSFEIKKSKIRGEVSMGMICAEDEIGLGASHDGIMVLPENAVVGTKASDYFKIENDTILEVDLTPNRIDAGSHIGIARDITAYLKQSVTEAFYKWPSVDNFKTDNRNLEILVSVENAEACPRYAGVTLTNVNVAESPNWLKNRLKAIGLNPINNVVDVTNFVLHEMGQPLHAFDAGQITGNQVIVKTLPDNSLFTTLDGVERKLNCNDLMICDQAGGMCIAGVFGGQKSGVTANTTSVFIESAYFNPVYVRKTARRHGLNTDASFRFERGIDPNITIIALKRAALLIKELCGAQISSDIVDIYPSPINHFDVTVNYNQVNRLIGQNIEPEKVKSILNALEMVIVSETNSGVNIKVPPYRVDVKREADVIEDILRIYGYNNIQVQSKLNSTLAYAPKPDPNSIRNTLAGQLIGAGFTEMMANSLTKSGYYIGLQTFNADNTVSIVNPLSQDLNSLRQSLIFGAIETVAFNANRQNNNIKLFEFGNCYGIDKTKQTNNPLDKYYESEKLSLTVSGNRTDEIWTSKTEPVSFYFLKANVDNILERLGVNLSQVNVQQKSNDIFVEGLQYTLQNKVIVNMGQVNRKLLKLADVKQTVFFAEIEFTSLVKLTSKNKVGFTEISKFPEVRRDLALLLDKNITFGSLKDAAQKAERKYLKEVSLFDVFEGEKLGQNKKSYALSFILQDKEKTLEDKQIDKIMASLIKTFEQQFGAQIR